MIIRSRIEEKHLLSYRLLESFEQECLKRNPDGSDQYKLTTVYLTSDVLEIDMINNAQRVDKYRIRYYPEVRDGFDTRIFAEIKSKEGNIRFKHTVPVSISENSALLQREYQIFNRMSHKDPKFNVINNYRKLNPYPLLSISCLRKVFMFEGTRVTIDLDLSTSLYGDKNKYKMYAGGIIVEFKYSGSMSKKASDIQNLLYKNESVSKYRTAREMLLEGDY